MLFFIIYSFIIYLFHLLPIRTNFGHAASYILLIVTSFSWQSCKVYILSPFMEQCFVWFSSWTLYLAEMAWRGKYGMPYCFSYMMVLSASLFQCTDIKCLVLWDNLKRAQGREACILTHVLLTVRASYKIHGLVLTLRGLTIRFSAVLFFFTNCCSDQ